MSVMYKNFEIVPQSLQLQEQNEWTTRVMIINHKGYEAATRTFTAPNNFKTEEEANEFSINFGKRIIDGKYQEHSVTSL